MISWSRKQFALYQMAEHTAHTYAVHGPVRSGKTMPAVHGFARTACKNFAGHQFIIASRSQRQLNNVVLTYLREFAREHGMNFRAHRDGYQLNSWLHGPPNVFIPLIGNDVSSPDKASGFTVAGALMDEAHAMPDAFMKVCQERCSSIVGSKFVAIANPSNPQHPFKTDLVDQTDGEDALDFPFELADNETLTRDQVDRLFRIYPPGPMRERRIFGKWVATQGLVYPFYQDAICRPPEGEKPYRHSIAIDHADSSVTHAIRFDWYRQGIWAVAEWRHDGRQDGPLQDVSQAQRIQRRLVGGRNIADWYCDPAAVRFAVELGNMIGRKVTPAQNDVMLGIEKTTQWMADGTVKISPACEWLIKELGQYEWDEKASERGEDKPVKKNDHGCDAFRYFNFTTARRQGRNRSAPRLVRARAA